MAPNASSTGMRRTNIREFPLHEMDEHSKITIIGKPGSGKSWLIRDIIRVHMHKFPVAKIFSGSESTNHFYSELFPSLYLFEEYSEDEMEKFYKRQQQAMANPTTANPKAFLVIDDCSDDPKFFNRPIFHKFMKNGRHWEMMLLLSLQHCMDIKPAIRSSIDYIFIFRHPNENDRKSLYKNYAGIIGNYNHFCDIMDQVCEKYTALVIDNRSQSNELDDCIYFYKAREHAPFKFGCSEYRQWADARYNMNYKPGL